MFQMTAIKFLLVCLVAATLGAVWFLDSNVFHWSGGGGDRVLPEPETMVADEPVKNDSFKPKEFVPTNEWQTIEENQPIPPGLHVEMNLKTGEKKAKLMEPADAITNGKTGSLAITSVNDAENKEYTRTRPVNLHKFKSYEELKDDLKELNLTIKSDMELMDDLSVKFKEQLQIFEDSDKKLQNILTDLEYLLHQVDTAEVFVTKKGIESIIIPCINSNSNVLKAQGALILGSAASNNQKVQIAALEAGVIPLLLKYINDDYEFAVQKDCLYALATVIRHFPAAQKQFIENNGIQTFMSVLKWPTSGNDSNNLKLQRRISQLLEDIVIEVEDAKLTLSEEINSKRSEEAKERVHQYDELKLKDKLVENGWCQILGNEFIVQSQSLPKNEEGHEMVEAAGKSLLAMNKLCKAKLQGNKPLYNSFFALEVYYKNLLKEDNTYDSLYQLLSQLTNSYDPVLG